VLAFYDGGSVTNLPIADVTGNKAWIVDTYTGLWLSSVRYTSLKYAIRSRLGSQVSSAVAGPLGVSESSVRPGTPASHHVPAHVSSGTTLAIRRSLSSKRRMRCSLAAWVVSSGIARAILPIWAETL